MAVGAYSLRLNGAGFPTDVKVYVAGQAVSTTRLSATQIMATGTAPASWSGMQQAVQVWALGPGSISSDVLRVSFGPAGFAAASSHPRRLLRLRHHRHRHRRLLRRPPPPPPPPGSGTANLAAARFLEQASFGPNACQRRARPPARHRRPG